MLRTPEKCKHSCYGVQKEITAAPWLNSASLEKPTAQDVKRALSIKHHVLGL